MFAYELEGLKRLKVPVKKWGSSYRVKIRSSRTGRMVYITNPTKPSNLQSIAKQYKVSITKLKKHMASDYSEDSNYRFYKKRYGESHLYEHIPVGEFYDKLENVLTNQKSTFKINIALGYDLVSITDEDDEIYWHPREANTMVFDRPIAVNSKADINKKVLSEIRSMELANRLPYPSSGYRLKAITGFRIFIYYLEHPLGSSEAVIPKVIRDSKYVINFPKTNNKCVFHCIAYHKLTKAKDPRRIQADVKDAFKKYCDFKGMSYTVKLFKSFNPIDLMKFDELEECFQLAINVYTMDIESNKVDCIRESVKYYKRLDILSHENHALYIKNIELFQSKYLCAKCDMMFKTALQLSNHSKNRCDELYIASFPQKPTAYRPVENMIKRALQRHRIVDVDHYMDHFIVYDFESILKPISISHGSNTEYVNQHIPVSVSICDSLTNGVQCFINDDPKALLTDMFNYIDQVATVIRKYNVKKYLNLLKTILKVEEHVPMSEINNLIDMGMFETFYDVHMQITDFNVRKNGPYTRIKRIIDQVPVMSFNGGSYDINLVKNDVFSVIGCENIRSVIRNPSYMCIATDTYKLLDVVNYLPQGTSLDKYLTTYLGGCKCEDKIQCTCGMAKGIFPYEYITSFEVLNQIKLPPKSAFDSSLKGVKASADDYKHVQFIWDHYEMKNIKDLLIWYNNLDVVPFVKAIQAQRELFKQFDLDMLTDGISLPSLAEKVMYQTCYKEVERHRLPKFRLPFRDDIIKAVGAYLYNSDTDEPIDCYREDSLARQGCAYIICYDKKDRRLIFRFNKQCDAKYVYEKLSWKFERCPVQFELDLSKVKSPFSFPKKRISGYKKQDSEAEREFGLTLEHLNILLRREYYRCSHCQCILTPENVSADRIDNAKGHIDGNIMISCVECNVARKDMSINWFRRQKWVEANAHKLVFSIDVDERDIYQKMKDNIAGGPSIIFNRYAKRNETTIRGGKMCKKIIGYDANALYLWALGNEMPCGRLTTTDAYDGIVDDIKSDKMFGFLECDIETPERLKDYFSEMTPIFKNIEIDCTKEDVIGSHMFEYNQTREKNKAKPARKLIGSYFGEKILIYTPLLKWYLSHGLEITRTYSFIKTSSSKPFMSFEKAVSDARREGAKDVSKSMVATMMKLVGNSAFGRSGMDMTKHKSVKYESDDTTIKKSMNHFTFHSIEELDGACEITMKKRRINNRNPIHLSIAIYQLAKLRMLQFYYDFIDYYIDRSDFQYQEMDTDSAYIAFSDEDPFENLIKPQLKEHFKEHKYDWLPRDYNDEFLLYDTYKAGLFKQEWSGDAMVSLSSKNYICYLPDETYNQKVSAKGVQQAMGKNADILNPNGFESVVRNRITLQGTNRGFRVCKETKSIITYSQTKTALNYYYDKRQVLDDGVSTIPLSI